MTNKTATAEQVNKNFGSPPLEGRKFTFTHGDAYDAYDGQVGAASREAPNTETAFSRPPSLGSSHAPVENSL
jgi:hypothetical protein